VQLVGDLRLETDQGRLSVREALSWLNALEIWHHRKATAGGLRMPDKSKVAA
jgi:hypothetical protein